MNSRFIRNVHYFFITSNIRKSKHGLLYIDTLHFCHQHDMNRIEDTIKRSGEAIRAGVRPPCRETSLCSPVQSAAEHHVSSRGERLWVFGYYCLISPASCGLISFTTHANEGNSPQDTEIPLIPRLKKPKPFRQPSALVRALEGFVIYVYVQSSHK